MAPPGRKICFHSCIEPPAMCSSEPCAERSARHHSIERKRAWQSFAISSWRWQLEVWDLVSPAFRLRPHLLSGLHFSTDPPHRRHPSPISATDRPVSAAIGHAVIAGAMAETIGAACGVGRVHRARVCTEFRTTACIVDGTAAVIGAIAAQRIGVAATATTAAASVTIIAVKHAKEMKRSRQSSAGPSLCQIPIRPSDPYRDR